MHQRFPHPARRSVWRRRDPVIAERRKQETLDAPAARHPVAQQPCREHTRVVHDEEIAGVEELRKRRDGGVLDAACRAREEQQPTLSTLARLLRNQLGRKLVVEIRNVHLDGPFAMLSEGGRQASDFRVSPRCATIRCTRQEEGHVAPGRGV